MEFCSRIHIKTKNKEVWKRLYGIDLEKYWFTVSARKVFEGLDKDYILDCQWGCPPNCLESFVKDIAKCIKGDGIVVADNTSTSVDPYTYVFMCLGGRVRRYYFEWPQSYDDPHGIMWELYKEADISDLASYLAYGEFFHFNKTELETLKALGIDCRNPEDILADSMNLPVIIDENEYVCNPKDYIIENGVLIRYSGNDAYIRIPDGVISIGEDKFQDSSVFTGNRQLKGVRFPNGLVKIQELAFQDCTNLLEVLMPDGLTEIGSWAFSGCKRLRNVYFPEGLKVIGIAAFQCCTCLEEAILPDGVEIIGRSAFLSSGLKKLKLPDSINEIGETAFANTCLVDIVLPNTVKKIEEGAFGWCTELSRIALPEQLEYLAKKAFKDCTSLEEIDIPDSVKSINSNTFSGCHFLKKVSLPKKLEAIGESAFLDCKMLQEIELPETIISIEASAFQGTGLRELTIPGTVGTVAMKLLQGCSQLNTVIIEDGIEKIGGRAFAKCPNLEKVIIKGKLKKKAGPNVFLESPNVVIYAIPSSKAEDLAHEENVAFFSLEGEPITYSNTAPKVEEKVQCSFCDKKIVLKNTLQKRSPDGSTCIVCKKCCKTYNLSDWETIFDSCC